MWIHMHVGMTQMCKKCVQGVWNLLFPHYNILINSYKYFVMYEEGS